MGLRDDEVACGREEVSTAHSPSRVDAHLAFSEPSRRTAGRYLGRRTKNRARGEFEAYVWLNGAYVPLDSARWATKRSRSGLVADATRRAFWAAGRCSARQTMSASSQRLLRRSAPIYAARDTARGGVLWYTRTLIPRTKRGEHHPIFTARCSHTCRKRLGDGGTGRRRSPEVEPLTRDKVSAGLSRSTFSITPCVALADQSAPRVRVTTLRWHPFVA